MSNRLSRKAFGYCLRRSPNEWPKLLVLTFADMPNMPFRLPGGTLEGNEAPLAGLQRELKEEVGLETVDIIRKLGIQHYYKAFIDADVERHDYLVQAPDLWPSAFSVVVQGEGGDAGEVFNYRWITANEIEQVDAEFHNSLTPDYFLEFFTQ